MKILYMPCHQRLRQEERLLLEELGHTLVDHEHVDEDYDLAICVHKPVYWPLFPKIKKKGVPILFRSIGQSTPGFEQSLKEFRRNGIRIIRYSPNERFIPNFAGEDYLIRFYKDEGIYQGYTGEIPEVFGFAKRTLSRPLHTSLNAFRQITEGLNPISFGRGNEDLDGRHKEIPEEELVDTLRRYRCMVYTGTFPASYTLGFMECLSIGIPIVALGEKLWNDGQGIMTKVYEVPQIIKNGENGFVSNSVKELRGAVQSLLNDLELAKRIGEAGRKTSIELFSKEKIKQQWKEMLDEY